MPKDADCDELLRAGRRGRRVEAIFSPAIAQRMMDYFVARPRTPGAEQTPFPVLTEREREILQQIAKGQNNSAIASQLALSVKTVQN